MELLLRKIADHPSKWAMNRALYLRSYVARFEGEKRENILKKVEFKNDATDDS